MMVSDIVEKTLCCAWNVACLYLSSDGEHKLDSIKYLRNAYVRLFGTMAIRIQHLTNYSFKPYFSYIELIIYPVWLATSSSTFQSNYTTYMYSLPDTICFAGKSQKECHQLLCLKKFQKCVIGPPQKIATLHHRKGHLIEWKSGFYKMGSSSAQSLSWPVAQPPHWMGFGNLVVETSSKRHLYTNKFYIVCISLCRLMSHHSANIKLSKLMLQHFDDVYITHWIKE